MNDKGVLYKKIRIPLSPYLSLTLSFSNTHTSLFFLSLENSLYLLSTFSLQTPLHSLFFPLRTKKFSRKQTQEHSSNSKSSSSCGILEGKIDFYFTFPSNFALFLTLSPSSSSSNLFSFC